MTTWALRAAAFALGMGVSIPGYAQLPSTIQNPVLTLTAHAAGTVNSADLPNHYGRPVICVFNQSAHTGTPSSTLSIQGKDPGGSGNYVNLITSGAITSDATPTAVAAGVGVQTTSNVSSSLPIPALFRVSVVIGGSSPAVTGTVGCSAQ